jgi:hypothetical protein
MVPPRAIGRSLVLTLAFVVSLAALPACVPVPRGVVGPEAPVSRPVTGAPRWAKEQAVAYGGGVFLVTWVDEHNQIWATRVDRNGAVIDPSGVRLTGEYSRAPEVAFDGTNFLVVWAGFGPAQGRRVSPQGALLDPTPIELSAAPIGEPQVSFGGGAYLIVWSARPDDASPTDVFGTRLRPDGTVIEPANVPIVLAAGEQSSVDIAFDGTHHLLVWAQDGPAGWDIHGTLVTPDGVAIGPVQPISMAVSDQSMPGVSSTASGFFVVWLDGRAGHDLYGARVRSDGSVIDGSGILIGGSADPFSQPSHDVSSDGVNAVVTWHAGYYSEVVRAARIDPTGSVLDPGGIELTSGTHPASAFDGTHHLLTFLVQSRAALDGTRLTSDLTPLDPGGFPIAVGSNEQRALDLASDGVNSLVVWTDNRLGRTEVYGARVGPDGQNLDGAGFLISDPGAVGYAGDASVVFDGTGFFVVWSQGGVGVRAARVSRSGEVLSRFDIAGSFGGAQDVASLDGMILVAWVRYEEVMVTRIAGDGTVLDPEGIVLHTHLSTLAGIDVAAGASEFLVTWYDGRYVGQTYESDVYGAIVTTAGAVTPTSRTIATGPADQSRPGVAWHDGTYLVVWEQSVADDTGQRGPSDIHGARVDAAGTVLDPASFPISTAPGDQRRPDVASNGQFLVTWADRRRSPADGYLATDVYGATIGADRTVGPELFISAADGYDTEQVLAAIPGSDDHAVVYGRYLPDEPYGVTRAFLRRVSPK